MEVIAYREKTDVIRDSWITADTGEREKISLRSNRILIPYTHSDGETKIIIRGKTLPATLMMGCSALYYIERGGKLDDENVVNDIRKRYHESISDYQRSQVIDNWTTLFVDGYQVIGEGDHPEVDYLEELARGGPIDEEILARGEEQFQMDNMVTTLANESQVSMIASPTQGNGYRVSILERSVRADGKFQFVIRPQEQRNILVAALSSAAYIYEASTLLSLAGRLKEKVDSHQGTAAARKERSMMTAAHTVAMELRNRIVSATKRYNLHFWPEEPEFIAGSVSNYLAEKR